MNSQIRFRSRSDALDRLISGAELVMLATGFRFAEGPVWLPNRKHLVFSDVSADRMYKLHDNGDLETFRAPSNFGNGNALDNVGRLVTCEHQTRRVTRTLDGGTLEIVADKFEGHRLNSPNDVTVRSDGMIYFTDPSYGLEPQLGGPGKQELDFQGLYRVTPEGRVIAEVTDFKAPNGLAFSPDERLLYVDDTERFQIRVFRVAPNGFLTAGQVFLEMDARIGKGWPDGLKVDLEGNVWSSGPGGLWVVTPNAQVLGIIELPEPLTNLGWGGTDFQTLYITTAEEDYSRSSVYRFGPLATRGTHLSHA